MRRILLAGVVLAISACSGGNKATNNASGTNSLTADNMIMNQTMPMDLNASGNGMMTTGSVNGTADANTQNLMEKDRNTHDPDTNLANGL